MNAECIWMLHHAPLNEAWPKPKLQLHLTGACMRLRPWMSTTICSAPEASKVKCENAWGVFLGRPEQGRNFNDRICTASAIEFLDSVSLHVGNFSIPSLPTAAVATRKTYHPYFPRNNLKLSATYQPSTTSPPCPDHIICHKSRVGRVLRKAAIQKGLHLIQGDLPREQLSPKNAAGNYLLLVRSIFFWEKPQVTPLSLENHVMAYEMNFVHEDGTSHTIDIDQFGVTCRMSECRTMSHHVHGNKIILW